MFRRILQLPVAIALLLSACDPIDDGENDLVASPLGFDGDRPAARRCVDRVGEDGKKRLA